MVVHCRGPRRVGQGRTLRAMAPISIVRSPMRRLLFSMVVLTACSRTPSQLAQVVADGVEGTAHAAPRNVWSERPKNALPPGFTPPTSLAPLIKELKPAVVNISTTQIARRRGRGTDPNDPFNQFFGQMFG